MIFMDTLKFFSVTISENSAIRHGLSKNGHFITFEKCPKMDFGFSNGGKNSLFYNKVKKWIKIL